MFKIEESANRINLKCDDIVIGSLFYVVHNDIMDIKNVYINPDFRGQKLGDILIEHAYNLAMSKNYKIKPTCPFALKRFTENKEYSNLLE